MFDFNSLPSLPKSHPRNKLPFDTRAKQKLHYSTALKRYSMYTFWLGNEQNPDMWHWHTVSQEEAMHLFRHARIPFVLTMDEEDWVPLPLPMSSTQKDIEQAFIAAERQNARTAMEEYEELRQQCMKETGWHGNGMIPEDWFNANMKEKQNAA